MKNSKFFYLYLAASILALISLIVKIVNTYPKVDYTSAGFKVLIVLVLFYLTYKTYHEKRDQELM